MKKPRPETGERPGLFPERKTVFGLLVLATIVFVALRWPCASVPLERDEGAYAYVAQRALAGEVPYRDVFDHKPPGVYLAYLLPVGLFSTSVVAIHLTQYAATALSALFLFLATRRLAEPLAAACAVLVFAVLTIEPAWLATAANTEQFLLVPMAASLWCLLYAEANGRGVWWAAAGALAAAACWVKPVAITHALFLAVLAAVRWRLQEPRAPLRELFRRGLWAVAGGLAVTVAAAGALAALGSWPGFVDAVISHNLDYAGEVPFSDGLVLLSEQLRGQVPVMWPVWLAAAAACFDFRRARRGAAIFLLGALVAAGAGIAASWHFYGHYFLQAAPALAAAAGLAAARAIPAAARMFKGRLATAAVFAVPAAILAPGLAHDAAFFFRLSPEEKVRAVYGANPFDLSAAIAGRLTQVTGPRESTLIFGSEPQILFLSRRRSATRYIEFYPLMLPGATGLRRQREAWEDIVRSAPRAVLMTQLTTSLNEDASSPRLLRENVVRMLATGFVLDGLRVFDVPTGRMVFGPAARENAARAGTGAAVTMDMFLFVRR